jgi:hypothetical protein
MNKIVSLLLLTGVLLLSGCWGSGEAKDLKSRHAAFKEVLGFDASSSVTNIESSWYFLRDSYIKWLRFSCDEATISKIKSLKGESPATIHSEPAPGDAGHSNPNAPLWWTKAKLDYTSLENFTIDRSNTNFSDVVGIWIDTKTRTVYAARTASH